MKLILRVSVALTIIILGLPHRANTGTPQPPAVVELDFSVSFSCTLTLGEDPEKVVFMPMSDGPQRQLSLENSHRNSSQLIEVICQVEEDTVYRCSWDTDHFVEIDLNASEWVYISVKKFNYVLSGNFRQGLLSQIKPIKCSFPVNVSQ